MSKRIYAAVSLALIAAGLYWLMAEFDFNPWKKHTSVASGNDVEFNWVTCLLYAGLGAVLGFLPSRKKSSKNREDLHS